MYKKELDSGTLLFVEVPMDAQGFNVEIDELEDWYQLTFLVENTDIDSGFCGDWEQENYDLPQGNWQLLGFSTELTDEKLKDVMPRASTGFYYAYNAPYLGAIWNTATEAFKSLKSSFGLDGKKLIVLFNPKK